jgi:rubrerythrin
MANVFAGSEIVEMGIQIEENGRDFYETLVSQSKNDKAKDIFKYLAEQEKLHIKTFQKILEAVHKYEPPESYPGEYFLYMKSLADEHVFTKKDKGKEIAKGVKGDKEAVDLGVKFEKESILFYEGMKKVVPENQTKVLDSLIAQENSHLLKLYNLKENLS